MKKDKRKKLEKQGWKIGTVTDFLKLTSEEEKYIEMKLALSTYFQKLRKRKHLTQTQVAALIRSSQSRVAKIESAEKAVSLDLVIRSILALGSTTKEIAKAIQQRAA